MLHNFQIYYDYFTFEKIHGSSKVQINAPLNKIPVFLRGGSIIPKRQKTRGSSSAMHSDPFTLVIALNENVSDIFMFSHISTFINGIFSLF